MKRPSTFFRILFLAVLLSAFCHASFAFHPGDTIKPLTKINKEFLVVANIVYTADTIAGIDSLTIAQNLFLTSKYFAPIGASFTLCKVNYIYNFQFDTLNVDTLTGNKKDLLSQFWVANRINMFFTQAIVGAPIGDASGVADFGGITSPKPVGVYLQNSATPIVYAHELGHYFGLYHTFETKFGFENVNGSNCAVTGDSICDTPADPGSDAINVDGNCIYTYMGKDPNGEFYDPDVTNIMSYYPPSCICGFTRQQYDRMAKYYLKNPIEW